MLSSILSLLMLGGAAASAAKPIKIPLFPDGVPTSNGLENTKEYYENTHLFSVSQPELWIYPAKKPNGQAIICAPGGGYRLLSTVNEGTAMADWMNAQGITWAVLKYRMPNGHKTVPLEDGLQAMKLMRRLSEKYGFDPNQIGIMGSSAGGHFAATLATMYDSAETRPAFQILLYPVITMEDFTHKGTRTHLLGENPTPEEIEHYTLSNRVNAQTPPAFLVLATDDKTVPPMNSYVYIEKLQQAGVPYSLHVYPTGGHGFGFKDTFPNKREWTAELEAWLRSLR